MRLPTVKSLRKEIGVSQNMVAELLGVSPRTIQSYEQGRRLVPPHVEKLVLLHTILGRAPNLREVPRCWELKPCDPGLRARCPSSRIPHGGLCWFVTGSLCHGKPSGSWAFKRKRCFKCQVMRMLLGGSLAKQTSSLSFAQ